MVTVALIWLTDDGSWRELGRVWVGADGVLGCDDAVRHFIEHFKYNTPEALLSYRDGEKYVRGLPDALAAYRGAMTRGRARLVEP
jgi:hypothetical protein